MYNYIILKFKQRFVTGTIKCPLIQQQRKHFKVHSKNPSIFNFFSPKKWWF